MQGESCSPQYCPLHREGERRSGHQRVPPMVLLKPRIATQPSSGSDCSEQGAAHRGVSSRSQIVRTDDQSPRIEALLRTTHGVIPHRRLGADRHSDRGQRSEYCNTARLSCRRRPVSRSLELSGWAQIHPNLPVRGPEARRRTSPFSILDSGGSHFSPFGSTKPMPRTVTSDVCIGLPPAPVGRQAASTKGDGLLALVDSRMVPTRGLIDPDVCTKRQKNEPGPTFQTSNRA